MTDERRTNFSIIHPYFLRGIMRINQLSDELIELESADRNLRRFINLAPSFFGPRDPWRPRLHEIGERITKRVRERKRGGGGENTAEFAALRSSLALLT